MLLLTICCLVNLVQITPPNMFYILTVAQLTETKKKYFYKIF